MPLSKSTTFLTCLKNLTTIERRRRRIEPPLSSFHHRSQQQSSPSPPYRPEFVGSLPGKHPNLYNHILTLIRHDNGTVDSNYIQTRTVAFQASTKGSLEELDTFVKEGKVEEAVEVLGLLEKQSVVVDLSRFLLLMQACGEAKALEEAKVVHEHIVRVSSLSPLKVSTYNIIIRMYLECGSPNDAFAVFKNVREPNLTSWDTMIIGLAKNGLGKDAVDLFYRFKQAGLKPDGQMFIGVFLACSVLGDTREGMLHFESMSKDYNIVPSMEHYVSIVDMLGSTGHLDEALRFIKNMPVEPSIGVWEIMMNLCRIQGDLELGDHCAWDTMITGLAKYGLGKDMITGLAKNGLGKDAVDLFSRFKQAGFKPDGQMFIGIFLAYSVLGDTREGMLHFESMSKDYGIVLSMEHYVSIVDMLGSTGRLDEALEFIEKMQVEPSIDVWEKMMVLCRIHGDLELGDHCAELVEQLDPSRLNEQSKAGFIPVDPLDLAMEKEKDKTANEELIRGLKAQMKEAGYVPDLRIDQELNIDRESMEDALLAHSEGLALSHGLLSSPPRTQIRIIKNLLVCKDCHNALKIITKIVGREISIQDMRQHHLFKDGKCSCKK